MKKPRRNEARAGKSANNQPVPPPKAVADDRAAQEDRLIRILRSRAQAYLRLPNVTSVGVGEQIKDGKATGLLAIQFTVAKKLSELQLEAAGLTPLPKAIEAEDGAVVPVDVIERSYKPSYQVLDSDDDSQRRSGGHSPENERDLRRRRLDVLQPGVSISHISGSAGTLGAIVFDKESGQPYVLSNWHVLNGPNGRIGDIVVQPGPYDDSSTTANLSGRLVRSHLGLVGDCAIASIEGRSFKQEILGLSQIPKRIGRVNLGDKVVKSGRTTGVTRGVIARVGVVVNLNYGGHVGVQQIGGFEIRPVNDAVRSGEEISDGGDSGAVWMIDEPQGNSDVVVGLHFAGETDPDPAAEHALACNIHSVLDKLKISLVDPSAGPEGNRVRIELVEAKLDRILRHLQMIENGSGGPKCQCNDRAAASARSNERDVAFTASERSLQEGLPIYGNWCGPGHGGGVPVDDLDKACMQHDRCYDAHGYFNCECDHSLLQDIDSALKYGSVRPLGRLVGPIIRRWFQRQPCVGRAGLGAAEMSSAPSSGVRQDLRVAGIAKTTQLGSNWQNEVDS